MSNDNKILSLLLTIPLFTAFFAGCKPPTQVQDSSTQSNSTGCEIKRFSASDLPSSPRPCDNTA